MRRWRVLWFVSELFYSCSYTEAHLPETTLENELSELSIH